MYNYYTEIRVIQTWSEKIFNFVKCYTACINNYTRENRDKKTAFSNEFSRMVFLGFHSKWCVLATLRAVSKLFFMEFAQCFPACALLRQYLAVVTRPIC